MLCDDVKIYYTRRKKNEQVQNGGISSALRKSNKDEGKRNGKAGNGGICSHEGTGQAHKLERSTKIWFQTSS